jgi:hypothetical protein
MEHEQKVTPTTDDPVVANSIVLNLHTGKDTFSVRIEEGIYYDRFWADLTSFYEKGMPTGGVYGDEDEAIAVNFRHLTLVKIVG